MITCAANGFRYVGGTTMPIEKRFRGHITALRSGTSKCRLLQACADLYGVESLSLTVIKEFPPEQVPAREAEAIARLKPELNIQSHPEKQADRGGYGMVVEYAGQKYSPAELGKTFSISPQLIRSRWARGLKEDDLVAPPHRTKRKQYTKHR